VFYSDYYKIGDLGLCILELQANNFKDIKGVMPYLAPELLNGHGSYSRETDVYAFGMIMWEISSAENPFGEFDHDLQLALSIVKGLRPEITKDTPPFYRDLLEKCWHPDPTKRSNAQEIYDLTEMWSLNATQEVQDQLEKAEMTRQSNMGIKKEAQILHPGAVYTSRLMTKITHGNKFIFIYNFIVTN
jgi:serine/threonine protein kinase